MTWRRRHTVGTIVLFLGAAFYGYFIHRSAEVKDAEGWHLRFSYLTFHCRVCLGNVEELTYKGMALPVPDWRWKDDGGSTARVNVLTPVGEFTADEDYRNWMHRHTGLYVQDTPEGISPDELSQQWYDARGDDLAKIAMPFGPFIRKKDTPAHWCLLATHDEARWVSPEIIGELKW